MDDIVTFRSTVVKAIAD